MVQVLEHYHRLARQSTGIKGVGELHGSLRAGGGKLQLCGDLLPIDQQRFAGRLVHENAAQFVGLAHFQILIGNCVGDGNLPGRLGNVLPVHQGRGGDFGNALILVVDGTQLNHRVVAGNRNVGDFHKLVPLVALAGQFL